MCWGQTSAASLRQKKTEAAQVAASVRNSAVTFVIELVGFLPGLFLRVAIAFLQLAGQLILFTFDDAQVVVGELSPFLLYLAFELFPVSFHPIGIHVILLIHRRKY